MVCSAPLCTDLFTACKLHKKWTIDKISTVLFRLAEGWPKKLHHRLLFLPLAAFPLANGTVVLISVIWTISHNLIK